MGEYVKKKKDMKFQSQDALKAVQTVLDEAAQALNDKSRKISDSPIADALAGAVGVGLGAGIGFAGLYLGGLIGGGMAAGLAVLAAPAVVLGGAGIGVASHIRNKKLREAKEILYKDAVAKQSAIVRALKEETNADKDRIEYLQSLNILLQSAIRDLQHDLGKDALAIRT